MRLYVGNLAYSTTEDTLRNEFGKFGNVTSALVVIDRVSGRSRGFGFVEFSTPEEGTQAINGMNGTSLDGREITDKGSVNQSAVLARRSALVDALYARVAGPGVIVTETESGDRRESDGKTKGTHL